MESKKYVVVTENVQPEHETASSDQQKMNVVDSKVSTENSSA